MLQSIVCSKTHVLGSCFVTSTTPGIIAAAPELWQPPLIVVRTPAATTAESSHCCYDADEAHHQQWVAERGTGTETDLVDSLTYLYSVLSFSFQFLLIPSLLNWLLLS